MTSIRDEDLVLHYYGESSDPAGLERQIESSPEIRERFEALRRILDSVEEPEIPTLGSDYSIRVWQSLEPTLTKQPWWRRWLGPAAGRGWVLVGSAACLLVAAFLAGRISTQQQAPQTASVLDGEQGRDRALFMTVASHLEQSEMLLLELINVDAGDSVDVASERQLAGQLQSQSRLYRQAAVQAGQLDVADLLERLEVVLVELANGPDDVGSTDLEVFRQRLEDGDLLFRVRIVGSRLRKDTQKPEPSEIDDESALNV